MKIIVFGGSGFLGSHVADVLSANGHNVIIFDIKKSPYLKKDQKMIIGDISNSKEVDSAVKGVDYVYNFAGLADLDTATTKPIDTINTNILGNINILEASRKAKVKRFIYASTIYVYSHKGGFYRCSKQASELYIEEYQKKYGLEYTILRYGSLYGPRANEANGVYRMLRTALETKSIKTVGRGDELREYINVKDAAQLSVDILNADYANKHMIITGHYPMKYEDMLFMIKEILNDNIKIQFDGVNLDHYNYTPYSFIPKIGQKLISNQYTDMGQGLLECLHEIQTEINK
ncbi:NAD-dependent epimerase/dehydratase family protein [Candidatus Margulisiibacteriota bacterium]